MERIKIGISACLLGKKVRYDGGHKLDFFLKESLGQYVELVPVCPEVEFGLGVPRKHMHMEGKPESPRLIITETSQDITDEMIKWAGEKVIELDNKGVRGFIFKSNSPSCGIRKVKIIDNGNVSVETGTGIFAGIFIKHFLRVPVADEVSLHEPGQYENFIERVLAYAKACTK